MLGFLLFSSVILFNWLPIKKPKRIYVSLSSFVVSAGKSSTEINFADIAYIDQNIVEGVKPYYESITFLDSHFNTLYKLEAKGFDFKTLVLLCERIQQSNYEISDSDFAMNSVNKLLIEENTFDV